MHATPDGVVQTPWPSAKPDWVLIDSMQVLGGHEWEGKERKDA